MLTDVEIEKITDKVVDKLKAEGLIISPSVVEAAEETLKNYRRLSTRKDKISRDTVHRVDAALETIRDDPYYDCLFRTYIMGDARADIASDMYVDPSTISRNRQRLLRKIAPML